MSNLETVGDRLREVRGKRSQDDFAKLLGIGRTSLIRYEKGTRAVDADLVARLWVLFKVDVLWLITGIKAGAGTGISADEEDLLALFRAAPLAVKAAAIGALQSGASARPASQRARSGGVNVGGPPTPTPKPKE